MKIGILNECFLSQNQLGELRKENEVEIYEITSTPEDAKIRMQDAEIIFVDQFICPLSNEILDEAKGLKLIIMNTTSYHLIDIDYLKKRNIILCNTPDFCSSSVAELVFLYTLSLARKTNLALQDNMDAPFEIYPDDMNHRKYVGYNLENKTIGVIGLGNIGKKVCSIAQGFGMDVIGVNRSEKYIAGCKQVGLNELLSQSDIVVVTIPFTDSSANLLHEEKINLMKNGVIIVNISSQDIINEEVLVDGLSSGKIGGYGLDNFTNKDKNHPFYNSKKVMILPHLGFFSQESLDMIGVRMMEGFIGFIEDKNINRVI